MFSQRSTWFAFSMIFAVSVADGGDWPQWRGPQRNGISAETGLLKEWPKDGPPLVWQAKAIGEGYSTPSVVGDRIYLLSNKGSEEESVLALSTKDGSQIWSTPIGGVGKNTGPQYPGSRSTPTVDGEYLYVLGSDGDIASVKASSGEIRWKKNIRTEFGGTPGAWAYSESPLVDGDKVVCSPGGKTATLVAFDKENGDVIWKSGLEAADEAGYASVIAVEVGGLKQYVQFLSKGLVGVEAATGRFLWRYESTAKGSMANIPTPVVNGTMIYSATSRSGGGVVQLSVNNGEVMAKELYFKPKLPSSIGGSVNVGDYLYGTTREGFLCVEFATGEPKWQSRSLGASSILYAEERLYIHGENGDLALVEAIPEEYREKGRFTPPDMPKRGSSKSWAYPVIADGKLYIRELNSLWCFDVKAK